MLEFITFCSVAGVLLGWLVAVALVRWLPRARRLWPALLVAVPVAGTCAVLVGPWLVGPFVVVGLPGEPPSLALIAACYLAWGVFGSLLVLAIAALLLRVFAPDGAPPA